MESQTSAYSSSVQDTVISFRSQNENDDVHFINALLLQLIRTVELEELLTVFHSYMQQALPLEVLSLISEDRSLNRGTARSTKPHELSFLLNSNDSKQVGVIPTLKYRLSRRLSLAEKSLLEKLHDTISHPVLHAMRFSKLSQLASKDALTGLGNRSAFDEHCLLMQQASERKQSHYGLLVLDLDNFKAVNDGFGHDEGDNVLTAFTTVLNNSLRANEKAYRFGGDEFCCLLETDEHNTINIVAQRILQNAANNLLLQRHAVTVSIGGTLSLDKENRFTTFKRADKALYEVKQQGKHGYLFR